MKKMKKLVASLLIASMAIALMACGSKSSEDKNAESSVTSSDTNALYINLASEPDHLDPAANSTVDGACLAVNSFVGLLTYNEANELIPGIASDMPEISEDGLTYTVKMNETNWSNGEPLVAQDFIDSWNRAAQPDFDYSYLFDGVVAKNSDGTLAAKALDDYTIEITLDSPCPYFSALLAFPTLFPVYNAAELGTDTTWANEPGFVSNGAYKLDSWSHEESMVYVKNDEYYDADNVKINELHFMLSADDTAIYAAYNNGDLDFIDTVPNDEIQSLLSNPEFYIVDQLGTAYVQFNVGAEIFANMTEDQAAAFRQAVSKLIDREFLAENIGQTGQVVADSFIPKGMGDSNGHEFKNKSYYDTDIDLEGAVALLEEAGYTMTDNGDGTYTPSPAISFEYLTNDASSNIAVAEAIQADLAVCGIDMKIASQEWQVFLNERKAGNFTMTRGGWIADFDDPINMLEMFVTESGNNDPQFGKATAKSAPAWTEYDNKIAAIKSETDNAVRADLMHEAEDMLMDTWAVVPTYFYNDIYMQKSNVTGVFCTPFGFKYFMGAEKQ